MDRIIQLVELSEKTSSWSVRRTLLALKERNRWKELLVTRSTKTWRENYKDYDTLLKCLCIFWTRIYHNTPPVPFRAGDELINLCTRIFKKKLTSNTARNYIHSLNIVILICCFRLKCMLTVFVYCWCLYIFVFILQFVVVVVVVFAFARWLECL